MNISQTLKTRRLELGISQLELAKYIGFKSKSSIHWFEAGKREWKFRDVVKACELLELEIIINEIISSPDKVKEL